MMPSDWLIGFAAATLWQVVSTGPIPKRCCVRSIVRRCDAQHRRLVRAHFELNGLELLQLFQLAFGTQPSGFASVGGTHRLFDFGFAKGRLIPHRRHHPEPVLRRILAFPKGDQSSVHMDHLNGLLDLDQRVHLRKYRMNLPIW